MNWRLGKGFVEFFLKDTRFQAGVKRIQAGLKRVQAGLQNAARYAKYALVGMGGLAVGMIKAAADAEETENRFRAVFKNLADEAAVFVDEVTAAVGRSKFAIMESMASFQSFFVGMGFGRKQALKLSKQMQSLTLDFASFNNLADKEAAQRFISALSGSGEVLQMFGINIKQAALGQQLMNMGLAESAQKASEQEKALARVAIIMESMGAQGAVGDAVKTADSFTNRLKRMKGELYDLAAEIGAKLIPAATKLLERFQTLATYIGSLTDDEIKEFIGKAKTLGKVLIGVWAAPKLISVIRGFWLMLAFTRKQLISLASVSAGVATAITAAFASVVTAVMLYLGRVQVGLMKTRMAAASAKMAQAESERAIEKYGKAKKREAKAREKGDIDAIKRAKQAQLTALETMQAADERLAQVRRDNIEQMKSDALGLGKLYYSKSIKTLEENNQALATSMDYTRSKINETKESLEALGGQADETDLSDLGDLGDIEIPEMPSGDGNGDGDGDGIEPPLERIVRAQVPQFVGLQEQYRRLAQAGEKRELEKEALRRAKETAENTSRMREMMERNARQPRGDGVTITD